MKYRSPSGVVQYADTPVEQVRLRNRGWTPVDDEPAAENTTETEPAPASTEDPEPCKPAKSASKSAKK